MTPPEVSLLPDEDQDYLDAKEWRTEVEEVGSAIWVVVQDYVLPAAYTPREVNLLVVLPTAYPNANPDMFWTSPDVMLSTGGWPLRADCQETKNGRGWQRWSRHFAGSWRPGVDGLRTYFAAIRRELERGF